MKAEKLFQRLLTGSRTISFTDFEKVLRSFGFVLDRTSGSHHIYKKSGVQENINIQEVKGKAKPYQIGQFLDLVKKYNLQQE